MRAIAVFLPLVVALAFSSCASPKGFPHVSGRWNFEDFTKCYHEAKQRDELPPLYFPAFVEEAFTAFQKEALPTDSVIEFQIDSPDYWIYRYSLMREGQIVSQREFRQQKRI